MMRMTDLFYLSIGFAGLVTVASLWNLWGGDMFPAEGDPKGGMSGQFRSRARSRNMSPC
jgi:hypothetical protein